MAEVSDAPRYTARTSNIGRPVTYAMLPDALLVEKGRSAKAIPYAEVTSLRVFESLTAQRELFKRCELRSPRGKLVMQSLHMAGVTRSVDQRPEFRAFLAALVPRIQAANPAVALLAGQTGLFRFGAYFAMALCVAGVAFGIAIAVSGEPQGAVVVVMSIVGFVTAYLVGVGKAAHPVDRDSFLHYLDT